MNEFITIAIVHAVAAASPGPNVVASITNALVHGFRAGVLTVLGVVTGNIFHTALGIFGVTILLKTYPTLGMGISVLGILYLLYIAYGKIRNALTQTTQTSLFNPTKSTENFYISGIIINITNVKGALFFLMIFSTFISPTQPLGLKVFYGIWMMGANFCILCTYAWIFRKRHNKGNTFTHERIINLIGGLVYISIAILLLMPIIQA